MGMGAIGLIGGLASTGVQLYGMNQQAKAQAAAARYNAGLAEREAANTEAQTTEAIRRKRMNNRAAMAELGNRIAGSGLQGTTGTPLNLLGETAGRMELEIGDAARVAAMQAASMRAQGKMGLWEADVRQQATKTAMIGTAIGGLTSAFGKYQEGSYQGIY